MSGALTAWDVMCSQRGCVSKVALHEELGAPRACPVCANPLVEGDAIRIILPPDEGDIAPAPADAAPPTAEVSQEKQADQDAGA